jgi:nitrogen fixation/metabolism regulation signal transduction histidine kinase
VEYLRLTGNNNELYELHRIRNILDVSGIGIYSKNGTLEGYDINNKNVKFSTVLKFNISQDIQKSGYYYEINRDSNGEYMFYYYVNYGDDKVVLISQDAPDFIKIDNTKIIQNRNLYHDLLKNRDRLKSVYTSTLIISVLLSIIIAVALSLFFAQFMIKRIQNILMYIEQIKQGKFPKKEAFQGKDELSQLVVAFDDMSQSLDKMNKVEKMQKEQILTYKNDLENIINNLSLGVVVYDDKFNIKNINNITESILGINLVDAMFKSLNEWKYDYKHLTDLIELIIKGVEVDYNDWEENILIRVKYTIKNLYIRTVKFSNNGKIEYITLISDVTNLIKAKQNQAWADIAKRLAHEIKNPLTPIVLSAERIEMKLTPKLAEKDQEFLHRLINQIIIQVDDLKNMVNKFRDFANINKPTLLKISINTFFNQFMALYENTNYIKLESHLDNNQEINADSGLLRQVFHNLVKNSLESIEDQENKEILIKLYQDSEGICILIKDNGSGFDEIIMNNLFEPYRTTKGVKGSGLGMAIVKKIIDDHNGKIEVFNDNGANIVVKLPLIR